MGLTSTMLAGLVAGFPLLLPGCDLQAADANPEPSPACPGAAAWREAHRSELLPAMVQRDQNRTFTSPELRLELERRFEADQRERLRLIANPHDHDAGYKVRRIDMDNLAWLKALVKDNGIPTVAQVGETGVHWTWLLVQHADADPQLQLHLQPMFAQRQAAGELPADDLAKLTDRIMLAAGRPQRFGTQFDWFSGRFEPKSADHIADIENNRRKLGLMSFADYACMMNGRLKHEPLN